MATPTTLVIPGDQPQTKTRRVHNAKNRTPLNRLQYMREYNRRKKAEKLAFEYGYIKPEKKESENATYTGDIPVCKSLATGNPERDRLLRELEQLRRSGNDMAALAAIKAYADLAGITAQDSKIGALTPDQAMRYRDSVQANIRATLDRCTAVVEVLTTDGYERIVGCRAKVLAAIDRLMPPDTPTGSIPAPDSEQIISNNT